MPNPAPTEPKNVISFSDSKMNQTNFMPVPAVIEERLISGVGFVIEEAHQWRSRWTAGHTSREKAVQTSVQVRLV